jgi:hypothetical protein
MKLDTQKSYLILIYGFMVLGCGPQKNYLSESTLNLILDSVLVNKDVLDYHNY